MQRPSIATNKQSSAPSQRDQIGDRSFRGFSPASARRQHSAEKILLAGAVINQWANAQAGQPASHFPVALRRPAFCTPPRTGIQNRKIADALLRQLLLDARLNLGVPRKIPRKFTSNILSRIFHLVPDQPLSNRKILLDHMSPARHYLPRVPKTRRRLPWFRRSIHHACPRQPRQHSRSNRPLQIHGSVVMHVAYIVPNCSGALQSRHRQGRLSPSFQVYHVDFIHERPRRRPAPAPRRPRRAEQFSPPLVNQPTNVRLRT